MTQHTINNIRNIGIMAHVDAGKTTLTERILYNSGRIHKIGDVHHGNTTTDSRATEQKHGITISAAATSCEWKHCHVTILDTPGHVDFTIEVERSMRVLDGAIAVFSAVSGVEPQSETVWLQAIRHNVPRVCFVNKMDSVGADFDRCIELIEQRLASYPLKVQLPIGSEKEFKGVIDLISMTAWLWVDDLVTQKPIPPEMLLCAVSARANLIERVAEKDDACAKLWLEGVDIAAHDLSDFIRQICLTGHATPVLCGSAFQNIGVQPLLDAIIAWCPSPADRPAVKGISIDNGTEIERAPECEAPFSGLVAKVQVTRFGPLATLRVYSGTLAKGQSVLISNSEFVERVGRILRMHADQSTDMNIAQAGDVVCVTGLKSIKAGDTVCDRKEPILLDGLTCPDPVIEAVIEPARSGDQQKLAATLSNMVREDPSLTLSRDTETGQILIAGMGELQLQICLEELADTHGIIAHLGQPRVAYREALSSVTVVDHLLRKQTGGIGQFARIKLRLEPVDHDANELVFENRISGGAIPSEYIPAIKRGLETAMCDGPLYGFPLNAVKAVVEDGEFHANDSSAIAFERAAREAFALAAAKAHPVVLEPIMCAMVSTPEEYVGSIIGNLSSRRGKIVETWIGSTHHEVVAHVPLSEMFGYVSDLRSLSSGRANFSMVFEHYAKVSSSLLEYLMPAL